MTEEEQPVGQMYRHASHEDDCGCGHEHAHDEECTCGHEHHHHEHGEECTCGHDHEHGEGCECGHDHEVEDYLVPIPAEMELPDFAIGLMEKKRARTDADMAPTREFDFPFNGQTLHVLQWGQPGAKGAPMVLLHGFMQSGGSWKAFASDMAADHCVYALEFIGHGQSSKPQEAEHYSYEAAVDALEAFLREVACVNPETGATRRAHVVGYSMGGRVAAALALRNSNLVYSLILESCNFGPADDEARAQAKTRNEGWASQLREEGMEPFVAFWEELPLFETQKQQGLHEGAVREERLANDAQAMALCLEGMGKHTMPEEAELFDYVVGSWFPVKYICGYEDAAANEMAHRLEHEGIDVSALGCGHNVHLEAPLVYRKIVEEFLSAIEVRLF